VGGPKRKAARLNSQNYSQWARESPQAIAGGLQVPKEGEFALQARNSVCGERSNFQHFYWSWLISRSRWRQDRTSIAAAA
jgi:hypothetical protein